MKTKMLQFRYNGIEFPFAIQDGEVIISQSVERTGAWEPEQLGLYSRYISPGGTFQAIAVNRCRAVPTVPDQANVCPDSNTQSLWLGPSDAGGCNLEPLFIHSSFRTSSTWLWAKFRRTGARAFCEPFHEALGWISLDDINEARPHAWSSGHPDTDPYFVEYAPLIEGAGVPHYDPAFAFARLVPAGGLLGDIQRDEAAYLSTLIQFARDNGQTPVFGCTRSLGRAYGIKRALGGSHVFLHRPLLDQWLSYWSQYEGGNPYFLHTIGLTVNLNRGHVPIFEHLADRVWVGNGAQENVAGFAHAGAAFEAFLITHLFLYSAAPSWADLTISTRQLSTDTSYVRHVESKLSSLANVRIDLSDVTRRIPAVAHIGIDEESLDRASNYAEDISSSLASTLLAELRADFALLTMVPDTAREAIREREATITRLRDQVAFQQSELERITKSKRYRLADRLATLWNAVH